MKESNVDSLFARSLRKSKLIFTHLLSFSFFFFNRSNERRLQEVLPTGSLQEDRWCRSYFAKWERSRLRHYFPDSQHPPTIHAPIRSAATRLQRPSLHLWWRTRGWQLQGKCSVCEIHACGKILHDSLIFVVNCGQWQCLDRTNISNQRFCWLILCSRIMYVYKKVWHLIFRNWKKTKRIKINPTIRS